MVYGAADRGEAARSAPSPVPFLHPPSLVARFDSVSDALNGVGEQCNGLIEEEQRWREWREEQKGRQWTEANILDALCGQPELLGRGEEEMTQRLAVLTCERGR